MLQAKSVQLFIVYIYVLLQIHCFGYYPHINNIFNLLFNEITNLKFPPFLITGRIITYPPYLQGG